MKTRCALFLANRICFPWIRCSLSVAKHLRSRLHLRPLFSSSCVFSSCLLVESSRRAVSLSLLAVASHRLFSSSLVVSCRLFFLHSGSPHIEIFCEDSMGVVPGKQDVLSPRRSISVCVCCSLHSGSSGKEIFCEDSLHDCSLRIGCAFLG